MQAQFSRCVEYAPDILARMSQRSWRLAVTFLLALSGCRPQSVTPGSPAGPKPVEATPQPYRLTTAAASAKFDYYLLNLSWSPEFCYSHPRAVECSQHAAFVLHGLWPQNNDGTYPEKCSNAPGPADPATYQDIYPDQGLLEHEWSTHGTCSGLSADDFLRNARAAYRSVAIPAELTSLERQVSMPPEHILGLFTEANPAVPRDSMALSCGNNYLTAVELCLDKGLHPIACPSVRSCRAKMVRIPPP